MPTRLYDDHDELRRQMKAFAALMAGDPADVAPDLLPARLAFSALYHRHRVIEAAFAAGAAAAHPGLEPLAARLAAGDPTLDAAYSAHVRRWTPPLIVAEWRTYRAEVMMLQRRHHERLAWEEREAIPLLSIMQSRAAGDAVPRAVGF